jgi:hypothetical protein
MSDKRLGFFGKYERTSGTEPRPSGLHARAFFLGACVRINPLVVDSLGRGPLEAFKKAKLCPAKRAALTRDQLQQRKKDLGFDNEPDTALTEEEMAIEIDETAKRSELTWNELARKAVLPLTATEAGLQRLALIRSLLEWAADWHLNSAWCLDWALQLMRYWPPERDHNGLYITAAPLYPNAGLVPVEIRPPAWRPELESWRTYRQRQKAWNAKVEADPEKAAAEAHLVPTPEKRNAAHFDWLAGYQMCGWTAQQIADAIDEPASRATDKRRSVEIALTKTAHLVGLRRRQGQPLLKGAARKQRLLEIRCTLKRVEARSADTGK